MKIKTSIGAKYLNFKRLFAWDLEVQANMFE